ncbi:MAG: hypothetical protein OEV43_09690, partial [Coriobacteriia bacterium]|nr:hypothetical protein [Coriobacteriia bacterium]
VVLFGVAIIMHFAVSKSMSFRAIEGQPIVDTLPASQDAEWGRRLVEGDTVKSIDVEYHEDVLLFTTLSSTIAQADGRTYDASLSQPHWFDPLTMLSIQDYGLAPVVTYESADGTEDQAIAAMNIFPPGAEDSIELAESGLRLYVVAFPDYGQIEGRDVSLSYNIAEPRFRLAVKSMLTGEVLARGVVSLGEPLAIGDAVLTVDELRRHGTYRLNRSIGMPLMVLASLLMVGGLSLRLLSRRHDVRAWETHDGLRVDAWLDVGGRAAGLRRLHRFLPIAESKRARS